jgi:hypothetical protein
VEYADAVAGTAGGLSGAESRQQQRVRRVVIVDWPPSKARMNLMKYTSWAALARRLVVLRTIVSFCRSRQG